MINLNNGVCNKCPLSELRCEKDKVVNGIGSVPCSIMVIGEAPGENESLSGTPFVGKAGKKLDSLMSRAGLHRSQVFLSNTCRCFPRLKTVDGFRPPSWDEMNTCLPYLKIEIEMVKPNIIVPVGNVALRILLNDKKATISDYRGKEIWLKDYNVKCIPTFHPSAVLRTPSLEEVVVQDFKRIWESSQFKEMTPQQEGNYIVIDTIEKFDAFYERIMQVKEFAYDIETSGFNWQKDNILCISFSWQAGTAVVLPLTKWIGIEREKIEIKDKKVRRKGITEVKQIEVVTKYTEDSYEPWWKEKQQYIMMNLLAIMTSDIPRIAQNGKFDDKFFLQKGWNLKPLAHDTLLMHYLLHETAKGQHGLKDMALQYTKMGEYDKELEEWFDANGMSADKNRNYARVPESILYKYSAIDADVTFQLKQIFLPLIEKEGMINLFERLVMPLNHTLTITEFEGYKIDRIALNKAKEELQQEMAAKEAELKALIGDVDLDSPKQLAKLLFEDLKLPIVKQTKKGAPCTDEEAMTLLKDKHPVPMKIVEYRGIAKLLRTYILGIEEELDDNDKLHTKFLQEGTESGRLSSRNPNLQNIPKGDKRIKGMFTVEDGNVLVEADSAQAEFRFWGIYSNDPQLVKDLNDGLDIHKFIASLADKIPMDQVTKEQRQAAKSIVFGTMFSMGADKLAKDHNVTVEYAKHVQDTFFNRYPVAKQWRYNIVKQGKRNGFVRSIFGRVRHLAGINNQDNKIAYMDEQAAISSPIQGAASDYTTNAANRIIMKFKELGLHGKLRNLVHDAVYMEIPKAELDQSLKIMKEEMERRILGIQVPLKAEFKVGPNWADLEEIKVNNNVQNVVENTTK
jgi:DNA polymerase-1